MRQSSIGIRRIPSAGNLPPGFTAQNASMNALQQTPSRLPRLEEDVPLEPVATNLSSSSNSSAGQAGQNRLSKVTTRMRFWKSDKGKETDATGGEASAPVDDYTAYTSNMVDVLDTVGTEAASLH